MIKHAGFPNHHVDESFADRRRARDDTMKDGAFGGSRQARLSVLVTALLLACLTPPAWGDDQSGLRRTGTNSPGCSNISMIQAINNIESASGARVLNVEVDPLLKPPSLFRGPLVYGLLTVKDQAFKIYFVDISTGKVLQKSPDWYNYWRLKPLAKSELLPQAKINLVQAIALAESQTGGKTIQVTTNLDGAKLFYQITTLVGFKPKRVNIDAATGRLTEIPTD